MFEIGDLLLGALAFIARVFVAILGLALAVVTAPGRLIGSRSGREAERGEGTGAWWRREESLLLLALIGLAVGGGGRVGGNPDVEHLAWAVTTGLGIAPSLWWVVDAIRRRRLGVDLLALLALVGTLLAGEYLAGAVITVMLATGRSLEARARRRAAAALQSLVERVPLMAKRHEARELVRVPVEELVPGDLILIGTGEVVPVDGVVQAGSAVLDESAITGESRPVERPAGDAVRSGVVNGGSPFDLRVTTSASDSSYAGIVRLAREAAADTAPFVRLADRWAGWFLVVSLVGAGAAWAATGDFVRAVAVLVVATPCPLILAAPVAIVGGISRAARIGVLVKSGGVLERLAGVRVLLFDKTGTLTEGRPRVAEVVSPAGTEATEALRLAASLDQVSAHVMASAVVTAAHARGLPLSVPEAVEEVPGQGIRGRVEGHRIAVGKAIWTGADHNGPWITTVRRQAELEAASTVFVAVDDRPAAALLLVDPIRADAVRTIRALRRDGVTRTVMVSGDREDVAEAVGAVIGVDEVLADRSPEEKVEAVRAERVRGPVAMVGDGVNDAPALAAADVGVAVGAGGATASSEAADVVLNVNRLDRLGHAMVVARRARRIGLESVLVGMGLSLVAMGVAAGGFLTPTWGALLQEAIDVGVIVNALRAVREPKGRVRLSAEHSEIARRFAAEHSLLHPRLASIRAAADGLTSAPAAGLGAVHQVYAFLSGAIEPHQAAEDAELYPVLTRAIGGTDPLGPMSRAHVEINHQIRRLGRLLDQIDEALPTEEELIELRRTLYGIYALLDLHMTQEDEEYLSLPDDAGSVPSAA